MLRGRSELAEFNPPLHPKQQVCARGPHLIPAAVLFCPKLAQAGSRQQSVCQEYEVEPSDKEVEAALRNAARQPTSGPCFVVVGS